MTAQDPASINALLDAGDLEAARTGLSGVPRTDEAYIVVRVKLELYDGTLPPLAAIQQLVQLMRKKPDFPGAKELYQEASNLSYNTRQSSPPTRTRHPPSKTTTNKSRGGPVVFVATPPSWAARNAVRATYGSQIFAGRREGGKIGASESFVVRAPAAPPTEK